MDKASLQQELVHKWKSSGLITDKRLFEAFLKVPRDSYVSEKQKQEAYGDFPLPTIRGQSISQPSTVMIMLQALELRQGHKVLEVGAGTGYQAALMGYVVGEKGTVITTEVIPELVHLAKDNLAKEKVKNVTIVEADGSRGYEEEAPYDRIVITCACPVMPEPCIKQLKEGGIIVAPVGDQYGQSMIKGVKKEGKLETLSLGPFVFVPMRGKYGFQEDL